MSSQLTLAQEPELSLDIDFELEAKWNNKLTPSVENPFPLAPKDLVRLGLVTPKNYAEQNRVWRKEVLKVFSGELREIEEYFTSLSPEVHVPLLPRFCSHVWEFLSWGLGRERLAAAAVSKNKYRFGVVIRDNCSSACRRARSWSRVQKLDWQVEHGEILLAWAKGHIKVNDTFALVVSQLVQICTPENARWFMELFAAFLIIPMPDGCPARRVYMIHATLADNTHEGVSVEWGDTTPYDIGELKELAENRAGRSIEFKTLHIFKYYHQTYRVLRLMLA